MMPTEDGIRRMLRDLAVARRWPFRLVLTVTAAVVALSGADSWRVAGIVIGAGMALDVLRALLPFSRMPRDFAAEVLELARQDRKTIARRTRLWKLITYPSLAAFVAVGCAFYVWAPISPPAKPVTTLPGEHAGWIFHISHLCRQFVADLSRHGYVDRAAILPGFYSTIFAMFFVLTVVGCFVAPRSLALEWGCRLCHRTDRKVDVRILLGRAPALMSIIATGGFFAVNNLDRIHWRSAWGFQALHTRNTYFYTYAMAIGAFYICAFGTCGASLLYGSLFGGGVSGNGNQK